MYTASDIRNVQFSKNMGGYKIAEVEAFVEACAETVETLTAEKEELTKKLSILADKLADGIPCPVCGSVHHPAPAKHMHSAPDKAQTDRAAQARDAAEQAASKASQGETPITSSTAQTQPPVQMEPSTVRSAISRIL